MARLELILQAATAATHADAIRAVLGRVVPDSVLISVAFVRAARVEAIEKALKPFGTRSTFFIGIRNDITTIQGVKLLLALKAKVYAVDTATRDAIFHPKLYLAIEKSKAELIVGSANLTFRGLHNNIEASLLVTLDLDEKEDRKFINDTEKLFDELVRQYPEHVFQIKSDADAEVLFEAGTAAQLRRALVYLEVQGNLCFFLVAMLNMH